MGRVVVELALTNNEDRILAHAGVLAPERIRHATLAGLVDTGATRLVLPETTVTQLGLPYSGETTVRFADHRSATRKVVENVRLRLQGREGIYTAVVEPARKDALIGAIVLEDLDLLVDCGRQTLYPRDPDRIISEVE